MLRNYIKTAWRSLWKNTFYTLINTSGLAIGLATGIMLLLWVQNERSFDTFNTNYRDIYKLSSHFNSGGEEKVWNGVPAPLAVMARSIPGVQTVIRTQYFNGQALATGDKRKMIDGNMVGCVDESFFSVFTYPIAFGNRKNPFPNSQSIILPRKTARKLFGSENAVGKTVLFFKQSFKVSAVMDDFPENSSLQFDALVPMGFYARLFTEWGGNGEWKTIDTDMGNFGFNTYALLAPNADAARVGKAFSAAYKKARNGESDAQFRLQKMADMHLVGADGNTSALRMVQVFTLVVVLLLTIASINYVNLSTARSLVRAREVSIRKIVGASKWRLFMQFTTETALLFCLAGGMALLLISGLMPVYNSISGKTLAFSLTNAAALRAAAIAVTGTLLASSIYPALQLSTFRPLQAIKGKIQTGAGIQTFRRALVVFQFVISVVLLTGTLVIGRQMRYINQLNLGYDKSYVFSVTLPDEAAKHIDAIKTELARQPGILHVSASDAYNFTDLGSSTSDLDWPAKPAGSNLLITQLSADKDFIPTMKMQFVEGGNFTGTAADSTNYILNETAVAKMGLKKPLIGQEISLHGKRGTLIGVVRDFNFQSLKEKISPFIFFTFWQNRNILYVRTQATNAREALAAVERQYKKYAVDSPFSYRFLDQDFEAQYTAETHAGQLFNFFSGIAIFISCLGLFGLTTYTAQVKIREIGIRKVLGASVNGIVTLLSKDFLKLVVLAIIIAVPLSWWAMSRWLETFAYRVGISWWMLALSGVLALLIAFFTISFQAVKAALANPVRSLRSE
ncbi:MAG: ABC transporter permease [Mucilaginibacter polytrichastri]|nr:ABC transporter permease [Mucilaginibacter polytrichastri]